LNCHLRSTFVKSESDAALYIQSGTEGQSLILMFSGVTGKSCGDISGAG
jgi:hypothetical protein